MSPQTMYSRVAVYKFLNAASNLEINESKLPEGLCI
jgi:hypothetical protein